VVMYCRVLHKYCGNVLVGCIAGSLGRADEQNACRHYELTFSVT
jgi:hypothetical protein